VRVTSVRLTQGKERRWYIKNKLQRMAKFPKQAIAHKRLYHERKSKGLCIKCGVRPLISSGAHRCKRCLAIACERMAGLKQEAWDAALSHYGKVCSCCGESRLPFLTFDHTSKKARDRDRDQDGAPISGTRIVIKAYRTGKWPTGIRISCFNCNCGQARNKGVCPHEEERVAIRA